MSSPADARRLEQAHRVESLSDGQRECLRLVAAQFTSKEIAAELDISPHTVDQRIRGALQTLGVARRAQAARMLLEAETSQESAENPYQRLIYQAPYIAESPAAGETERATGTQIRHAGRAGGAEALASNTEQDLGSRFPLPLPFPTRGHPRNDMGIGTRLAWIALIAMGATLSAGVYLAGLESLARLLGS